ncbi:MAG: type II secretion system F family protein [Propionibacteriaceae bacterium]|jgi:pilus assembly protein TadC|nr:type II secretion system F family protein [Propionibacteriaceae bacterium]
MSPLSEILVAVLAGLSVYLGQRSPRRLFARRQPWSLPRWLAGRPGCVPLRLRGFAGAGLGVAVAFALPSLLPVNLLLGLGAAAFTVVALGQFESQAHFAERNRLTAQLPGACELLAVCLESGQPLRRAVLVLAEVLDGPLAARLEEVSARVALGGDEADAWLGFAETPGMEDLSKEIVRCLNSGVGLAQVLRLLAVEKRREVFNLREVDARKVGVRSVLPMMVCFLPSFVLLGVVPIIGGIVSQMIP